MPLPFEANLLKRSKSSPVACHGESDLNPIIKEKDLQLKGGNPDMKKRIKDYLDYRKNLRIIKKELVKAAASVLTAINESLKIPNASEQEQEEG